MNSIQNHAAHQIIVPSTAFGERFIFLRYDTRVNSLWGFHPSLSAFTPLARSVLPPWKCGELRGGSPGCCGRPPSRIELAGTGVIPPIAIAPHPLAITFHANADLLSRIRLCKTLLVIQIKSIRVNPHGDQTREMLKGKDRCPWRSGGRMVDG